MTSESTELERLEKEYGDLLRAFTDLQMREADEKKLLDDAGISLYNRDGSLKSTRQFLSDNTVLPFRKIG